MGHLSFKRGIHPKYHKETASKVIEELLPGKELIYPMSQHIGAPCVPIVKKGDQVYMGQRIGEASGFVSSPIHASVSGVVKALEKRWTLRGTQEMSVVIENDGLYEWDKRIKDRQLVSEETLTKEKLIQIVKEAGIVGMGGATFPSHVKLSTPEDKKVSYIIINAAECEPYLTSDHRLMLENGEEIIKGLKLLLKVFKEAEGIIGIEDNKPDAIASMKKWAEKEDKIRIATLHTKYPQGSEKHLIYALTKREVPSGKLPIEVGCIVHNVDTAVAIYRAFAKGMPLTRRIVTLAGKGLEKTCNVEVKIGTPIRELLEYAHWDEEKTVKVIAGGPMMGTALSNVDVPVMKGTSAILCFTEEEAKVPEPTACIRCGQCVQVCPMGLVPNSLHRASLNHHLETFVENAGMACIECGCCSYICPAKRDLVQSIRSAKAQVKSKK